MIALTPSGAGLLDVPVVPGADEARRWAAEELGKRAYQNARPGLGAQIVAWLRKVLADFLDGLGSLGGNAGVLVTACVVVLLVIAAVMVIRPRLNHRAARKTAIFDGPATLSADQHRVLARSAVERGELDTAVAEQFRAIVRAGEERGATSPAPGRTAAEIAGELRQSFPSHGPALLRAAELFNTVRYGRVVPARGMYEELVATDNAVAGTRPVYTGGGVGTGSGGAPSVANTVGVP